MAEGAELFAQPVEMMLSNLRRSESTAKLIEALCKASLEFGEITKDTENPFYKSSYTDLATLIKATRPALSKHGVAVLQWPLIVDSRAGVTTLLHHSSGEWMESDFTLPVTKQDAQGTGSAITYSRRYAYQSVLNVAGEEDDDGNAAVGKTKKQVTDKLAEHEAAFDQRAEGEQTLAVFQMEGIRDLCKQHGKTDEQVLEFLGTLKVNRIEKVLRRDFEKLKKWAIAPSDDLSEKLKQSVDIVKANALYPVQSDWARLYASAGERGIQQSEIKQYYTRKYKVISGKELTYKQFQEVEKEVGTWKAASITAGDD
jgi:hypothetical protein